MTPEELAWCKEIVTRTSHLLPAGCSMDVGLAEGGMSVVEYNDGWSLGGYGEDEALAQVVIARFEELARTAPVQ